MEENLGRDKYKRLSEFSNNYRNGHSSKTIKVVLEKLICIFQEIENPNLSRMLLRSMNSMQ